MDFFKSIKNGLNFSFSHYRGLLSFLSVSFCIWVLDSLVSAVIGIGLSWLFVYLIVDRPSLLAFRQNTKISYDKRLKKLLITAFPLGICHDAIVANHQHT